MLDLETALRCYATMMNTQCIGAIQSYLADDFHYASQWVFAEITSKQEYLDYIAPKLNAIRSSGAEVFAEMAYLDREMPGPCVVLAQGYAENLIALVFAQVANGKIVRLDLAGAPSPRAARRSGVYPGKTV